MIAMTIYPRGVAFVAVAILLLLAIDWFGVDWRIGLLAVSIDALLTLVPFFGGPSVRHPRH